MQLKNSRTNRFLWSLLVAAIALVIVVSMALAEALLRDIDTRIEIIEGPKWLGVYASENYTTDISGWYLANFKRGTSHSRVFYLKNDGIEPVTFYAATIPEDPPWGSISFEPSGNITLLRNQKATCNVTVWIDPDAVTGNYTFQLRFYEP